MKLAKNHVFLLAGAALAFWWWNSKRNKADGAPALSAVIKSDSAIGQPKIFSGS